MSICYYPSIHIHRKNKIGLDLMKASVYNDNDINDNNVLICNHYNEGLHCMNLRKNVVIGPGVNFEEAVDLFRNIKPKDTIHWKQPQIIYNVLSEWQKKLFETLVKNPFVRFESLPFPVDTDKFAPSTKENCFFVYIKHRHPSRIQVALQQIFSHQLLQSYNCRIFEYGSYSEEEYLTFLKKAKFGIHIGSHESQGFALQEALSCNCPLLIYSVCLLQEEWNKTQGFVWKHLPYYAPADSASWFNEVECGIILRRTITEDDIASFINNIDSYTPREYILRNLHKDVCARRFENTMNAF
jgi:glycosyltransferase involved in cell wall biosynthesis